MDGEYKPEDGKFQNLMYWFAEVMYRRLMSYTATNWYVLPYSGKIEFGSRG